MQTPIHAKEYVGDIGTTACFSGHRTEGIPFDISQPSGYRFLADTIYYRCLDLYKKGIRTFIVGMADGIDLMAGEAVLKLKKEYSDIRLVGAIPNLSGVKTAMKKFPLYSVVYEGADQLVYLFESYNQGIFEARNRFMVDNSTILIAYLANGHKGGTLNTYNYARKKGKNIRLVSLDKMVVDSLVYDTGIISPEELLLY